MYMTLLTFASLIVLAVQVASTAAASSGPPNWLPQSWYFDWTPQGAPLPTPITAQCETIHIAWTRGTATGPDGTAPYYLQIYTSSVTSAYVIARFVLTFPIRNYIFPFILPTGSNPQMDVTIPFAPGTQYQICMFDSNGSTGGCQAVYTVYANSTTPPTCANFTMPASNLNVRMEGSQGALSMYGWANSCSDIKVTPLEGKPPFIFTVAPALHPPFNITSHDMSPINWTVALSWASPFFVSLVDANGLSWSNGPLHSGDGQTNCLSAVSGSSHGPVGITIGAAIGGAVLGGLISIIIAYFMRKRTSAARAPSVASSVEIHPYTYLSTTSPPPGTTTTFSHQQQLSISSAKQQSPAAPHRSGGSTITLGREYAVEPFNYDRSPGSATQPQIRHSASATSIAPNPSVEASPNSDTPSRSTGVPQEGGSQVYVIHHDSGRAPVSVITSPGTEVVELPPGYSPEYLSAPTASQRRSAKSPVTNRSRS
ncbi:hypothetical protein BU17DRAFT_84148 [Hysterangium stoloniferum]|nr:hypothetical protein BU17DRAFT_84148 [Hysterangium stoloniferum]